MNNEAPHLPKFFKRGICRIQHVHFARLDNHAYLLLHIPRGLFCFKMPFISALRLMKQDGNIKQPSRLFKQDNLSKKTPPLFFLLLGDGGSYDLCTVCMGY